VGVLGNKHIPDIYIRASLEQRLDLLAGLIDTDGHVERSTGRVRIATCSAPLKDSLLEMLTGLGQAPYMYEQPPTTSTSGIVGRQVVYYVGFQPTIDIPVHIPHKHIKRLAPQRRKAIAAIRLNPNGEVGHCIQVDSPDGLYLVGRNLTPTHNSQLVSIYYPAWYIGRNPGKKVMMVSHTTDLAVDFGRKVRNLMNDTRYQEIFAGITLAQDSKSAGRWSTNHGSEYYATGVGSSLAGRGADMLIIDDPHSEQDVLAGNFEVFDKAYQWFTFGARTRLMPGGCVALVQCMTGDTPVLMQDGRGKPLRDIRVGDVVATYDDGRLDYEKVVNHQSNGIDCIYAIKMTSGIVVRANERHPFLVRTQTGETAWVRLKDLRTGDFVVSLKDATAHLARQPSGASEGLTNPSTATTGRTPTRPGAVWVTGGSTWARAALSKAVMPLRKLKGFAEATITKACGHLERGVRAPKTDAGYILNTGTGLVWRSTTGCWSPKRASVLSASNPPASTTPGRTGTTNCASITVTREGMSEPCSATTATLPPDTQKLQRPPLRLPSTCDFTEDQIESITPAGREEVFDVQINRTENFIANGLVSHNTRWHVLDLTGRVVQDMTQNDNADQYEVVEFPAIMEIKQPDGTIKEKALWPAFFDLAALHRTQASMPTFQWNAQYQQDPTAEGSALIKREWWRIWTGTEPPEVDYIIMALDAAAEQKEQADYTAITTWGVFFHEEERTNNLILLDAVRRRVEYPELRALATELYQKWEPDAFIVEKKSSGVALFQELRRTGMMLQEFTPHRGSGNKFARMQAVADIVLAGIVWVPTTRWAEELVEEIASFPVGAHDDLADTAVMALTRFRQGGFIRLPTDEDEDETEYVPKRAAYY